MVPSSASCVLSPVSFRCQSQTTLSTDLHIRRRGLAARVTVCTHITFEIRICRTHALTPIKKSTVYIALWLRIGCPSPTPCLVCPFYLLFWGFILCAASL